VGAHMGTRANHPRALNFGTLGEALAVGVVGVAATSMRWRSSGTQSLGQPITVGAKERQLTECEAASHDLEVGGFVLPGTCVARRRCYGCGGGFQLTVKSRTSSS
jgi:hypothetical protein